MPRKAREQSADMLGSIVCKYRDFSAGWYGNQELNLMIRQSYANHSAAQVGFVNRKFWEWCAIAQALDERCKLRTGMKGLGFAVGQEPLASHFAARGCEIVATDLDAQESNEDWIATKQHAASKEALYQPLLVNREIFERRVTFQSADMRNLGGLSPGYDFLWSSCALEHLGSLNAGIEFILKSAALLRDGGTAVHTTEFNVLSDDSTIERGGNVIYRRRDIRMLEKQLDLAGFELVSPDFEVGSHQFDREFDTPPYMTRGKPHLKLEIEGHVCTSFVLIIEKRRRNPMKLFKRGQIF